jgi:hypothetical protein
MPQAQRALEERRADRARMDDLMRHPSQAPAQPKKPILRKGSGAVLRSPPRGAAGHSSRSPRPSTVPAHSSSALAARSPSCSPVRAATAQADRPRREWSEGLKQFIAGQREAARPPLKLNQVGHWHPCLAALTAPPYSLTTWRYRDIRGLPTSTPELQRRRNTSSEKSCLT